MYKQQTNVLNTLSCKNDKSEIFEREEKKKMVGETEMLSILITRICQVFSEKKRE